MEDRAINTSPGVVLHRTADMARHGTSKTKVLLASHNLGQESLTAVLTEIVQGIGQNKSLDVPVFTWE